MLTDMIDDLINAKEQYSIRQALKALEKVGVDYTTAYIMAEARREELKKEVEGEQI